MQVRCPPCPVLRHEAVLQAACFPLCHWGCCLGPVTALLLLKVIFVSPPLTRLLP